MTARRLISPCVAALALSGLAVAPAAHARATKISVSPRAIHQDSRVVVRFRAPYEAYGADSDEYSRYRVILMAPKGCSSARAENTTNDHIVPPERLALAAAPGKRGWCKGVYRGKVLFEERLEDVGEDCDYPPESGSTMCDDEPLGTYSKERLLVGAFTLRVR